MAEWELGSTEESMNTFYEFGIENHLILID